MQKGLKGQFQKLPLNSLELRSLLAPFCLKRLKSNICTPTKLQTFSQCGKKNLKNGTLVQLFCKKGKYRKYANKSRNLNKSRILLSKY